jgi:hypothetical protein
MRLRDLRSQVKAEAPFVDVKSHSHNIVTLLLKQIAEVHGTEEANRTIRDFGLEEKGWRQVR